MLGGRVHHFFQDIRRKILQLDSTFASKFEITTNRSQSQIESFLSEFLSEGDGKQNVQYQNQY